MMEWQDTALLLAEEVADALGKYGTVVGTRGNRLFLLVDDREYAIDINVHVDPHDDERPRKFSGELWLEKVGDKKIQMIKEVRMIAGLGLKDAKDLVDAVDGSPSRPSNMSGHPPIPVQLPAPRLVLQGLTESQYVGYRKILEDAGGTVRDADLPPVDPFQRRITENRLRRFERELSEP